MASSVENLGRDRLLNTIVRQLFGSPTHPRGMLPLIRLCLHNGVEPWFIPMADPWRNGVVEKFNEHYEQKFLGKVVIDCK